MSSPNIGRLTLNDLDDTVALHMEAFKGHIGVRLGAGYVGRMLRWFICDGLSVSLGAWIDRRLVGYVFGAPAGYSSRITPELAFPAVLGMICHPGVLLYSNAWRQVADRARSAIRRAYEVNATPELPQPTFSLVGVATCEHSRRIGIGRQLVQEFVRIVAHREYRSVRLSVLKSNVQAIGFYRRLGWHPYPHRNPSLLYYAHIPVP